MKSFQNVVSGAPSLPSSLFTLLYLYVCLSGTHSCDSSAGLIPFFSGRHTDLGVALLDSEGRGGGGSPPGPSLPVICPRSLSLFSVPGAKRLLSKQLFAYICSLIPSVITQLNPLRGPH